MSLSNEEQLGVALRAQSSRDNDPDIAERICEEIKQSTVFRHNWQALLQSAPVAISATGACYAACFSEAGQRVTLNLPLSGHFKYLEYRSLSANLLACGDRGRFAFLEAETGLAFVKDVSTRAENKVVDIIEYLSDPDPKASQRLLQRQMSQLKVMADDCYDKVSAIDDKFDEWLRYTGDLHAACIDTDTTVSEKIHETAIDKILKETQLDNRSQTMADAKARSDQLGKSLDMASAAFKKASDEFPSGWDLMGQQIVGSIADCTVGSINSFVHAVTNPHLKVAAMASTIGDLLHSNGRQDRRGSSSHDEATPLISHSLEPEEAHPDDDLDDPAYDLVKRCIIDLNILHALLHNGPDGGVDWHAATGAADRKSSIRFVSGSLRQHLKDCSNSALKHSPSARLFMILEGCTRIADAINDELEKGRKMGSANPLASSAAVEEW